MRLAIVRCGLPGKADQLEKDIDPLKRKKAASDIENRTLEDFN